MAWVSERKDVLSTLFWILTVWAYVGYVKQPRRGRCLPVIAFFALGLMSKPMLVTLPLTLLLLDVWPLGRLRLGSDAAGLSGWTLLRKQKSVALQLLREKLPLLALTAASSIMTLVVQQRGGAVTGFDQLPLQFRAANAAVSYASYLGKMLWPARLAAVYTYSRSLPEWWVAGSLLVLIGVSVLVIRAARRYPYLPVGWLWYLGTLVPVIGLVQVGSQSLADRYTYVPLIGVFLMIVWGMADLVVRWPYRRVALPVAAGVLIAACAIAARAQVEYWRNNVVLWTHAAEATSENYLAHNNLGAALASQGRLDQARHHFSEALRVQPDYSEARNNLGGAFANQGRVDEAIHEFSETLRINPNDPVARRMLDDLTRRSQSSRRGTE